MRLQEEKLNLSHQNKRRINQRGKGRKELQKQRPKHNQPHNKHNPKQSQSRPQKPLSQQPRLQHQPQNQKRNLKRPIANQQTVNKSKETTTLRLLPFSNYFLQKRTKLADSISNWTNKRERTQMQTKRTIS